MASLTIWELSHAATWDSSWGCKPVDFRHVGKLTSPRTARVKVYVCQKFCITGITNWCFTFEAENHRPMSLYLDMIFYLLRTESHWVWVWVVENMQHPNFNVRLMVQMTPFHFALWALLTLFGSLNENTLRPLLSWLLRQGHSRSAMGLISPILNWHNIQATRSEAAKHMNVFQSWLPWVHVSSVWMPF